MTKIVLCGASGRMGKAIVGCATTIPGFEMAGTIGRTDDTEAVIARGDVVIDFCEHSTSAKLAELCAKTKTPIVIGTTGHTDEERERIVQAATIIPLVLSANFSLGVNTLYWLTRKAAEILGPGFDLEIVEMHHRLKRDSPSGTARTLADILAEVRALEGKESFQYGRGGIGGPRQATEIGLHSVRGGDVVGDHTVIFAGDGERVELRHLASSRDTFARGALLAAKWLPNKAPGLYDMQDVLGLK